MAYTKQGGGKSVTPRDVREARETAANTSLGRDGTGQLEKAGANGSVCEDNQAGLEAMSGDTRSGRACAMN